MWLMDAESLAERDRHIAALRRALDVAESRLMTIDAQRLDAVPKNDDVLAIIRAALPLVGGTPAVAPEAKALPGMCEEASVNSAVSVVYNGDRRVYRMCAACASHNVANRGAAIVSTHPLDAKTAEAIRRFFSGERLDASTNVAEQTTYGFGDLDSNGFFEYQVPTILVERHRNRQ